MNETERQRQQRAESREHVRVAADLDRPLEFMPCQHCAEIDLKSHICIGCRHNRAVIAALKQQLVESKAHVHILAIQKERAKAYEEMAEWCKEQQNFYEIKVEAEEMRLSQFEVGLDHGAIGAYKNSAAECRKRAKDSGGRG